MAILCQGCGLDLTDFPKNRINLGDNSRSKNQTGRDQVVATWGKILSTVSTTQGQLTENTDYAWSNKMCKNCYSSYERYNLLHGKIIMNLKAAIQAPTSRKRSRDQCMGAEEELDTLNSSPKRARKSSSCHTPARRCLLLSSESGMQTNVSPAVSVSFPSCIIGLWT